MEPIDKLSYSGERQSCPVGTEAAVIARARVRRAAVAAFVAVTGPTQTAAGLLP